MILSKLRSLISRQPLTAKENHNTVSAKESNTASTTMYWESHQLVMSNGVAIFHLATSRVVVCYDTREKFWFLPKGRRDEGEEGRIGAEREGWEESGYRNRLLPLPVKHRQPRAYTSVQERPTNVIEPVLTEFLPLPKEKMYLVHWYIAETLPPKEEETLNEKMSEMGNDAMERPYVIPPAYSNAMSFQQRVDLDTYDDGKIYEPLRHQNTGVDADEAYFISELMSIEEACQKLREREERVVQLGWIYIQERWKQDGGSVPESKEGTTTLQSHPYEIRNEIEITNTGVELLKHHITSDTQ